VATGVPVKLKRGSEEDFQAVSSGSFVTSCPGSSVVKFVKKTKTAFVFFTASYEAYSSKKVQFTGMSAHGEYSVVVCICGIRAVSFGRSDCNSIV